MQFKEIIGQDTVKFHLTDIFQKNRLGHAQLFLSKEGSGGLLLALAFAQYIVCEKVNGQQIAVPMGLFGEPATASESGHLTDSCGKCAACLKAAQLVHPDIHFSFPVISIKKDRPTLSSDFINEWRNFVAEQPYGNSYDWLQYINTENKQGNITASECNEISRKLSLKSFESKYKILVMWMPEYLGNEGNKLLKLIEEPPADTLFILVAENEQKIISTILSRTQLIKIPALSDEDVAGALFKNGLADEKEVLQLARMSSGNYRKALQLLQHADENWEVTLRDWMNSIVKTGPAAQIQWIEDIAKMGREKQKQFLSYFGQVLEHAIKLQAMGESTADASGNEIQSTISGFAMKLNRLCRIPQLEEIVREIDTAAYHVERNANAKILFHALTIRLYHIISNKSVILIS